MDTFTIRDLRERTGELVHDAEAGKLSVITKHGRPVFVAVPFDETLIKSGVGLSLAIKLFKDDVLSIGKPQTCGVQYCTFYRRAVKTGYFSSSIFNG